MSCSFKMINRSSTCALAAFLFNSGRPDADVNGLKLKVTPFLVSYSEIDDLDEWSGSDAATEVANSGVKVNPNWAGLRFAYGLAPLSLESLAQRSPTASTSSYHSDSDSDVEEEGAAQSPASDPVEIPCAADAVQQAVLHTRSELAEPVEFLHSFSGADQDKVDKWKEFATKQFDDIWTIGEKQPEAADIAGVHARLKELANTDIFFLFVEADTKHAITTHIDKCYEDNMARLRFKNTQDAMPVAFQEREHVWVAERIKVNGDVRRRVPAGTQGSICSREEAAAQFTSGAYSEKGYYRFRPDTTDIVYCVKFSDDTDAIFLNVVGSKLTSTNPLVPVITSEAVEKAVREVKAGAADLATLIFDGFGKFFSQKPKRHKLHGEHRAESDWRSKHKASYRAGNPIARTRAK